MVEAQLPLTPRFRSLAKGDWLHELLMRSPVVLNSWPVNFTDPGQAIVICEVRRFGQHP